MTTASDNPSPSKPPAAKPPVSLRVRMRKQAAIVTRWLHVYLSMASFAVVLFFAATGLTLNHPDWFSKQQHTVVRHGVTEPLNQTGQAGDLELMRLSEWFRAHEHVHGALGDTHLDDTQAQLSYRAPGYTADIFVDRATGKYDVTEVSSGFVAMMNDLHKGRDSGKVWGWLIDASAVLLVLVSVTGLVLIWFVYKRRTTGLLVAAMGVAVVVVLYRCFVP